MYTPAHTDYYLLHISHHIPKQQLERLEELLKLNQLSDMQQNIKKAQLWFEELMENIKSSEKTGVS